MNTLSLITQEILSQTLVWLLALIVLPVGTVMFIMGMGKVCNWFVKDRQGKPG